MSKYKEGDFVLSNSNSKIILMEIIEVRSRGCWYKEVYDYKVLIYGEHDTWVDSHYHESDFLDISKLDGLRKHISRNKLEECIEELTRIDKVCEEIKEKIK